MPPPAPHLPWVEVARRNKRGDQQVNIPQDPDAFLDLRISKLRHHNAAFPRQDDVYDLACRIYTRLRPLNKATCTLREAMSLAYDSRYLLHGDISSDINTCLLYTSDAADD